jgi:biotin carboxylase
VSELDDIRGKRVLVLGAGPYQMPVIRRALDLGAYVITADYKPDNPGHRAASAFEIVSTVDRDGILEVARKHRPDAVLTYGSDVSVPTVAYVAQELGLPGNPYEAATLLQRKDRIRALQRDLGLPHPRFAAGTTPRELLDAAPFPLLVKPADSSGSKGQSVVREACEMVAAFGRAQEFSRCGVVIAEELLPEDTTELVFEALIDHGRLVFGHYGHNWFCNDHHPRVPAGELVPGNFGADVIAEIDRQIQAIVSATGVRAGCMNFDALLSRGRVVILDIGLRSGGNYVPEIVFRSTAVDLTTASILLAAGISPRVEARHAAQPQAILSQVLHAHQAGRFVEARVDPSLQRQLLRLDLFVHEGDAVHEYTRGDAGVGVAIFEVADVEAGEATIARFPHPCEVIVDHS